jgi:hypothetical protein
MANVTFRRTGEASLARLESNVSETVNNLGLIPISNGRLIQNVVLKPAHDNVIAHGLDHSVRGFLVVAKTGPGDVYSPTRSNVPAKSQIVLRFDTGNAITVSLWVF